MTRAWVHVAHLGFTGTRQGMTAGQQRQLGELLALMPHVASFHHGDCVGADAQAHVLAIEWGIRCHVHPPTDARYRAWCRGGVVYPSADYLVRNQAIVQACDVLIAAPQTAAEEQRSGTWATIRYARKCGKPVLFLTPESTRQEQKTPCLDVGAQQFLSNEKE